MPALVKRLSRAALLASFLGTVPVLVAAAPVAATPSPTVVTAAASTSTTSASMARTILVLINRDRAARGLRALVSETRLASLAADRARWMASHDDMSHTSAGGTLSSAMRSRGIRASWSGECIGWTNATWGSTSARWLYGAWKGSPEHWSLMMSSRFTRVGIGFAYSSSNGETFGSLVFARL